MRQLDAHSLKLLGERRELLLNPDAAQIRKALSKVQSRARSRKLTVDEAVEVWRRVAQGGESSASAGVCDCPDTFQFGITSTVIVAARLDESLIGCAIGRQEVQPGRAGAPWVSADPVENPRQWLKEIVSTFWTRLDDEQVALIEQEAVAASMALALRQAQERGAERAGAKRRLQLKALFRSARPVYQSELTVALRGIAGELKAAAQPTVSWREFQLRWPSIAARYKRDLLGVFDQGVAQRKDLAKLRVGSPKYRLRFTTWTGAQRVFADTQLVVQVCSPQLSAAPGPGTGPGTGATLPLVKALRDAAQRSRHPVTVDTVGWFRVHVDDRHRLVFIDEVQSDVMEHLLVLAAQGDAAAQTLAKELADWNLNGFSSIRHWAAAIGYRVGMHSEQSSAAIADKTRSARKWNAYYGTLIKRFGLVLQPCDGYPAAIHIGN